MTEAKKLSCQALLKMAEDWRKAGKVQTAVKTYEAVIRAAPEEEAKEAAVALLEIAQEYEKEGKKNSAFALYKKVAFGKYSHA